MNKNYQTQLLQPYKNSESQDKDVQQPYLGYRLTRTAGNWHWGDINNWLSNKKRVKSSKGYYRKRIYSNNKYQSNKNPNKLSIDEISSNLLKVKNVDIWDRNDSLNKTYCNIMSKETDNSKWITVLEFKQKEDRRKSWMEKHSIQPKNSKVEDNFLKIPLKSIDLNVRPRIYKRSRTK